MFAPEVAEGLETKAKGMNFCPVGETSRRLVSSVTGFVKPLRSSVTLWVVPLKPMTKRLDG